MSQLLPISSPQEELTFQCAKCNAPINVPPPKSIVMNSPIATAIVFPHEKGYECSGCGEYYALLVNMLGQVGWTLAAAPKPDDQRITIAKKIPFA